MADSSLSQDPPGRRARHGQHPLPKDNRVPGRLELTVHFTELPQPVAVQGGMGIGIQREGRT